MTDLGKIVVLCVLLVLATFSYYFVNRGGQEEVVIRITSFKECVEAGNPVMESFPRKCQSGDQVFVEEIEEPIKLDQDPETENITVITCEDKRPEFCTQEYAPVCAFVQVECITEPCDPVRETFSNGCTACSNQRVISYTPEECEV